MSSGIERYSGGLGDFSTHWRITLTDRDAMAMSREQLDMIDDGLWLIQAALDGRVNGPLSTPKLGLPIRPDPAGSTSPDHKHDWSAVSYEVAGKRKAWWLTCPFTCP